jgi:hypothetical protein
MMMLHVFALLHLILFFAFDDIVSCIGHDHGKHWRNLIINHNTQNSCLFLCCTMVGHNFPLDKGCHF